MRQGSTMDAEVTVRLSDEARQERQDSLLYHMGEAERLEAKKAAEAKATQGLINAEWAECYRLRRVLLDDIEQRKQGDLRFGDAVVPSAEQAAAALAEVAKAAGEVLPSEPHDYLGVAAEVDKCAVCGSDQADPVHHGSVDPSQSHAFVAAEAHDALDAEVCSLCGATAAFAIHNAGEPHHYMPAQQEGDPCGACGLYSSDHVHLAEPEPEVDPANRLHRYTFTSESDDCTICGYAQEAGLHRRHEFVATCEVGDDGTEYEDPSTCNECALPPSNEIHDLAVVEEAAPAEAAPSCPACRSGECKVHPHAFEPGEPENKCAKCQRGRKAKTHQVSELVAVADVVDPGMHRDGADDEPAPTELGGEAGAA